MSIEVTQRHSDIHIESLKEYAQNRMALLKRKFPRVTKVSVVIDVDAKKHMYVAEVVAHRDGEIVVGTKLYAASGRSVIDSAAARAERQLMKLRVRSWKETVRRQRAARLDQG